MKKLLLIVIMLMFAVNVFSQADAKIGDDRIFLGNVVIGNGVSIPLMLTSDMRALVVGNAMFIAPNGALAAGDSAYFGLNTYYDGDEWKYRIADQAAAIKLKDGVMTFKFAQAGGIGGNVGWYDLFQTGLDSTFTVNGKTTLTGAVTITGALTLNGAVTVNALLTADSLQVNGATRLSDNALTIDESDSLGTFAADLTVNGQINTDDISALTLNRTDVAIADTFGVNIIAANSGALDITGDKVNVDSLEVRGRLTMVNSAYADTFKIKTALDTIVISGIEPNLSVFVTHYGNAPADTMAYTGWTVADTLFLNQTNTKTGIGQDITAWISYLIMKLF